jgi:hypothetical protein
MEIHPHSFALEALNELPPEERTQTVLFYGRGARIEVIDMDALTFVKELSGRVTKTLKSIGAEQPKPKPIQLFISYERSDQEHAQKLHSTLPRDVFEPWLDSQFLTGGEDWNFEIEDRIKTSDFFLVLNSPNLAAKRVGYVNRELQLAFDRQSYRQRGLKFIIPLRVENFDPERGQRDLAELDQIPLRLASFDSDVGEITKTIMRAQAVLSREAIR